METLTPSGERTFTFMFLYPIMMQYKNTKVKLCSPYGDTNYFDIVAGALQGDTLIPYLYIICLDYMLRKSIDLIKENGFKLTKKSSIGYFTQTTTDADNTNDIALHSLEPATGNIGRQNRIHML